MSLRDELTKAQVTFGDLRMARRAQRQEEQIRRDDFDFQLGKTHGLEDLDQILATIKQVAANGAATYEFSVDEGKGVYQTPYANGYYEAVRTFFADHEIGCYHKTNTDKSTGITTIVITLYWR